MEEQLSQQELDERIAILRRFRTLLEQQRTKFQEYLHVLELQERTISEADAVALLAHTQLETQIVEGIGSLQKVIVPMQRLYTASRASTYNPAEAVPIEKLQQDLSHLQSQVLAQNARNRSLLKTQMAGVQEQLSLMQVNNPYRARQSVYAERGGLGQLISFEA